MYIKITLNMHIKLASFKEEQLPYRSCAAIHVGAAVLAQVARSRRSEPLLDERSFTDTIFWGSLLKNLSFF